VANPFALLVNQLTYDGRVDFQERQTLVSVFTSLSQADRTQLILALTENEFVDDRSGILAELGRIPLAGGPGGGGEVPAGCRLAGTGTDELGRPIRILHCLDQSAFGSP
jgi:hypothetical protein